MNIANHVARSEVASRDHSIPYYVNLHLYHCDLVFWFYTFLRSEQNESQHLHHPHHLTQRVRLSVPATYTVRTISRYNNFPYLNLNKTLIWMKQRRFNTLNLRASIRWRRYTKIYFKLYNLFLAYLKYHSY